VLILKHLKVGRGKIGANVLIFDVLKKALLFTILLLILSAAENVIVGAFHDEDAQNALKSMGGGTALQLIATALLGFLILIPYFAYREIAAKLGEEALLKLLFTRQPLQNLARDNSNALKDSASGGSR